MHAKAAGGGLRLLGYYQANERLSDGELGAGRRVADRLEAACPEAVALVVRRAGQGVAVWWAGVVYTSVGGWQGAGERLAAKGQTCWSTRPPQRTQHLPGLAPPHLVNPTSSPTVLPLLSWTRLRLMRRSRRRRQGRLSPRARCWRCSKRMALVAGCAARACAAPPRAWAHRWHRWAGALVGWALVTLAEAASTSW